MRNNPFTDIRTDADTGENITSLVEKIYHNKERKYRSISTTSIYSTTVNPCTVTRMTRLYSKKLYETRKSSCMPQCCRTCDTALLVSAIATMSPCADIMSAITQRSMQRGFSARIDNINVTLQETSAAEECCLHLCYFCGFDASAIGSCLMHRVFGLSVCPSVCASVRPLNFISPARMDTL